MALLLEPARHKRKTPRTESPIDWDGFFAEVSRITRQDAEPYVTRLASRFSKYGNDRAFAVLMATLLSLRTRDKANETASENLFRLGHTPQAIASLSDKDILQAVKMTTFPEGKAKNVKAICEILLRDYDGNVPDTLDELDALPGIGRKTANLVLVEGFDKPGICVDTHVHRILNELQFVQTKTADETELVLRDTLPKKYWKRINKLLVMLGMFHCRPGRPLQGECAALRRFLKQPADKPRAGGASADSA